MAAIMAVAGAGEGEVYWRAMSAVVNNANTSKHLLLQIIANLIANLD